MQQNGIVGPTHELIQSLSSDKNYNLENKDLEMFLQQEETAKKNSEKARLYILEQLQSTYDKTGMDQQRAIAKLLSPESPHMNVIRKARNIGRNDIAKIVRKLSHHNIADGTADSVMCFALIRIIYYVLGDIPPTPFNIDARNECVLWDYYARHMRYNNLVDGVFNEFGVFANIAFEINRKDCKLQDICKAFCLNTPDNKLSLVGLLTMAYHDFNNFKNLKNDNNQRQRDEYLFLFCRRMEQACRFVNDRTTPQSVKFRLNHPGLDLNDMLIREWIDLEAKDVIMAVNDLSKLYKIEYLKESNELLDYMADTSIFKASLKEVYSYLSKHCEENKCGGECTYKSWISQLMNLESLNIPNSTLIGSCEDIDAKERNMATPASSNELSREYSWSLRSSPSPSPSPSVGSSSTPPSQLVRQYPSSSLPLPSPLPLVRQYPSSSPLSNYRDRL